MLEIDETAEGVECAFCSDCKSSVGTFNGRPICNECVALFGAGEHPEQIAEREAKAKLDKLEEALTTAKERLENGKAIGDEVLDEIKSLKPYIREMLASSIPEALNSTQRNLEKYENTEYERRLRDNLASTYYTKALQHFLKLRETREYEAFDAEFFADEAMRYANVFMAARKKAFYPYGPRDSETPAALGDDESARRVRAANAKKG